MPGHLCEECEQTVPRARYCPECGSSTGSVSIDGVNEHEMSEHFSEIALDARHESISFDALRSQHESYNNPLGSYVKQNEQPEILCEVKKCIVEGVEDSSWKISAGILDSGHLLVTDERIVAIFPKEGDPQIIDIPFADTVTVDESRNWRSNKLVIVDFQDYRYEFILNEDQDTLGTVASIVRDLNEAVDSENSSAVKFLNKIDTEVATADDAESALYAIAELFESRTEKTHFDQAVAESNSIEELGQKMAAMPGVGISQNRSLESQSTTTLAKPDVDVTNLRQRVTQTARNADPKDVGKYSLGAVLGFGTAAVSAPISTTVGIAALLAGGAATGAYASTNPNSMAARVDPLPLAMNARGRSSQLASNRGPGSYGTGAALGMVEYLSQVDDNNLDQAYAKWLSEVDIESVIEGQRVATRYANNSDEFDNPSQAGLLGGAAGLAYGYADFEDNIDEIVDDDILDELPDDSDGPES